LAVATGSSQILDPSGSGSGSEESGGVSADECCLEIQPLPSGLFECPLCYGSVDELQKVSCCRHKACMECWKEYMRVQITESRINITCYQCSKLLHPDGKNS